MRLLKEKLSLGMPLEEAVIKSALQSLRPILTTQIIAGIGFLPMAISSNAGAEVQRPLATVVIGGIIVVTLLSNLFLPIILEFLLQKGFTFEQKSSIQIASEPKENIAVVEKERKKKKMESSEVKKEPGEENKA